MMEERVCRALEEVYGESEEVAELAAYLVKWLPEYAENAQHQGGSVEHQITVTIRNKVPGGFAARRSAKEAAAAVMQVVRSVKRREAKDRKRKREAIARNVAKAKANA
jgi:hypothetical protein